MEKPREEWRLLKLHKHKAEPWHEDDVKQWNINDCLKDQCQSASPVVPVVWFGHGVFLFLNGKSESSASYCINPSTYVLGTETERAKQKQQSPR